MLCKLCGDDIPDRNYRLCQSCRVILNAADRAKIRQRVSCKLCRETILSERAALGHQICKLCAERTVGKRRVTQLGVCETTPKVATPKVATPKVVSQPKKKKQIAIEHLRYTVRWKEEILLSNPLATTYVHNRTYVESFDDIGEAIQRGLDLSEQGEKYVWVTDTKDLGQIWPPVQRRTLRRSRY